MINYNESYYTSNNYSNYLERSQRYEKLAIDILDLLNKLCLIDKNKIVVDFGCAVGFLLEYLYKNNYNKSYGVEISDWAIKKCKEKGLKVFKEIPQDDIDILISLDVFEHMSDEEIVKALKKSNPKIIIARIPVAQHKGESYFLDISKKDPTHINCKTKDEWKKFFKKLKFKTFLHLNLNTIYDSIGVFSFICLK